MWLLELIHLLITNMSLPRNICLPMHIPGHLFEHVHNFFSLKTQVLTFVILA